MFQFTSFNYFIRHDFHPAMGKILLGGWVGVEMRKKWRVEQTTHKKGRGGEMMHRWEDVRE